MERTGELGNLARQVVRTVVAAGERLLRAGRREAPATPCAAGPAPGCTVTVCRGCCCGTRGKHPEVDHDRQLGRLRAEVPGRLRVSGCLDLCDDSNVVVVCPSAVGRRTGARPVWLVDILDDRLVTEIVQWVRAGGPGVADLPAGLGEHAVLPPRQSRRALAGRPA